MLTALMSFVFYSTRGGSTFVKPCFAHCQSKRDRGATSVAFSYRDEYGNKILKRVGSRAMEVLKNRWKKMEASKGCGSQPEVLRMPCPQKQITFKKACGYNSQSHCNFIKSANQMGVCVLGLHCKVETKKEQVMERAETHEDNGHVIDITTEPSSSTSTHDYSPYIWEMSTNSPNPAPTVTSQGVGGSSSTQSGTTSLDDLV